jgi:hypothetical protein
MSIKTVGFLSFETGKVYKKRATAKAMDTKATKKEFNGKLNELQNKFNKY